MCVTLQVCPSAGYPDTLPTFHLRQPRGLDDRRLEAIGHACQAKLLECAGQPVVFDLIEVVREHLTESNLPSGQCVVCLYGFRDGDAFTKTACYHYLHSFCLARHLLAAQRNHSEELAKLPVWQQKLEKAYQPSCPVCRERIGDDVEPLRKAAAPMDLENAPGFELTAELRQLQARMAQMFARQKCRGGIIEVGAEETAVIAIHDEEEERRAAAKAAAAEEKEQQQQQQLQQRGGGEERMSAHQRVTCRNHKQFAAQSAAATKSSTTAKTEQQRKQQEAAEQEEDDGDEEENSGGRHRGRHNHHHDHHRRGGNRHNRRRQYHMSHSTDAPQPNGNGNGNSSGGSGSSNGAAAANATATR